MRRRRIADHRRALRAALVALLVAAAALAGCTSKPSNRDAPRTAAGTASWKPCMDVARLVTRSLPANVAFDCATVKVPQDWAHADNGRTFDIALIRARIASQRNRIGSLVVNPGGPGASGISLAVYLSRQLPVDVLRRFDLVGFDPRGVGRSSEVKCFSDADLDAVFGTDPDPTSQAGYDALAALYKRMAQSCATKYGDSLTLFSTEQTARDLDAIRQAVGDRKLNYLGYSYGTLLGATYAHLFGPKIRSFVLDGAVDPTQDPINASQTQAAGFEHAFDNFSDWCKNNASRCPIGPDPRAAIDAALAQGRTSPVTGADGRKATRGWISLAIVSALYSEDTWPDLAAAFDDLRRGDPHGVFALADSYAERGSNGHYSNLFDANAAIGCADDTDRSDAARIRNLQQQWRKAYPLFGGMLATGLLMCSEWRAAPDPYPTGKANGAPPIVVVGTTGDPATPYEQTARLAGMLGTGVVLTWQGEGHTAYPQTTCVTSAVDNYLIDLKVPPAGTVCPA
ncbi:MAG TPA: alpha/beta hydrolase [Micromonosporaceae bacterium]